MQDLAELFVSEMRRRRESLKMSQQGLGEQLGVDRNTISRIERGAPNLPLTRTLAIAQVLDTTLAAMLGAPDHALSPDVIAAFARNVRRLRLENGMNQRELAELVGVDRNWVSALESGTQNISLNTLAKFAAALGVSPVALLARHWSRREAEGLYLPVLAGAFVEPNFACLSDSQSPAHIL